MKKIISNSTSKIVVNTCGGYIDVFEVANTPIFFPKLMVKIGDELKVRGGMHVCAPNFGGDKIYNNLAKHGFARDRNWTIEESSENFIKLSLKGEEEYENLLFFLEYELIDKKLLANLKILNQSDDEKIVAPGFHPYFCSDHKPVYVNTADINNEDLADSIFSKAIYQEFTANGNHIMVKGLENVNEFVFWTDFKGDYICVEPTYNSIAFSDDSRQTYTIDIGEEFNFKIEIDVLDNW